MAVSNKTYAEAVEQQSKLAAQLAQAHEQIEKLTAALREAEGVIAEVCVDQHPDNVCCHVLRQVREAIDA
jgi:hypothetical protein